MNVITYFYFDRITDQRVRGFGTPSYQGVPMGRKSTLVTPMFRDQGHIWLLKPFKWTLYRQYWGIEENLVFQEPLYSVYLGHI